MSLDESLDTCDSEFGEGLIYGNEKRMPSCGNFADLQRIHGDENPRPIGLEWRDIRFSIGDKEILRGTTGVLEPGRLLAVLGGSGHGKTTLLNVLSARQRTRGRESTSGTRQRISMTGDITMNHCRSKKCDRRDKIAYVFQDSALLETETPRECLGFSAYLRLPRHLQAQQLNAYVDGMMSCLHLDACADTPVGSAVNKGLSGGETKRVSIGVELVSNPKIIFLDEPLSGLDAYNAFTVVKTLKLLAQSGVPVLMTLHQPSSEIFAELDDILILHEGETCFHGLAGELAEHFAGQGLRCPVNYNPSDYVMFTMARASPDVAQKVKDAWRASKFHTNLCRHIDNGHAAVDSDDSSEITSSDDDEDFVRKPSEASKGIGRGFCGELMALISRDLRMVGRQKVVHITSLITMFGVALVYGWFFFDNGIKEQNRDHTPNCLLDDLDAARCVSFFQAHFSVVALVSLNMMFLSLGMATDILHKERSVLLRERASGFYGVVPFFISKCIFEFFLMATFTFVTLLGTLPLVKLQGNPLMLFWEILLMAMSSSSLMYMLAAAVKTREQAGTLALLPQVLQFAFSGLLVPAQMVPASLQWMKWACPLWYGMGLVSVTEFDYVYEAMDNCQAKFGEKWAEHCPSLDLRKEVLHFHDVERKSWTTDLVMLFALLIIYRIIAMLLLARNTKFAV